MITNTIPPCETIFKKGDLNQIKHKKIHTGESLINVFFIYMDDLDISQRDFIPRAGF